MYSVGILFAFLKKRSVWCDNARRSLLWCSGCRCTDSCIVDVHQLSWYDLASPVSRAAPSVTPTRYLCCCGCSTTVHCVMLCSLYSKVIYSSHIGHVAVLAELLCRMISNVSAQSFTAFVCRLWRYALWLNGAKDIVRIGIVCEKSIGTKMNDLDLSLEVVSRSCQPLRYIRRWISWRPLQIEASKGPPIGNGIWGIKWLHHHHHHNL